MFTKNSQDKVKIKNILANKLIYFFITRPHRVTPVWHSPKDRQEIMRNKK